MKQVAFYYGLGSRYSYIAATQIERITKLTSSEFDWLPLYSGKLIEESGRDPFAAESRRGQYLPEYRITDAIRWARYYGIPYQEPDVEGVNWSIIVQACIAAKRMGHANTYSLAVFRDVFGKGRPPRTRNRLIEIASEIDLDCDEFMRRSASESVKDEEQAIFDSAIRSGVFGVPTFVVGDQLFWGQDRIPLLVHHLSGSIS